MGGRTSLRNVAIFILLVAFIATLFYMAFPGRSAFEHAVGTDGGNYAYPHLTNENIRDKLGMTVTTFEESTQRTVNGPDSLGLYVDSVEKNGPAEKAGIRVGDIVISLGGQRVASVEQFEQEFASLQTAPQVQIAVVRAGKVLELTVTL